MKPTNRILFLCFMLLWISCVHPHPGTLTRRTTKSEDLGSPTIEGQPTPTPYCDCKWVDWCKDTDEHSPKITDAKRIRDYLKSLGDTECAVCRDPGSKSKAYTQMDAYGTAKANIYFTNFGDTVRGYEVAYKCSTVAEGLGWVIDHCSNKTSGRVLGEYILHDTSYVSNNI